MEKVTTWNCLFSGFKWYRKRRKSFWVYERGVWIRFSKEDSCFKLLSFNAFKNQYKAQNKTWEDYTEIQVEETPITFKEL